MGAMIGASFAAGRIETAGQCIEHGDRARGLRGIRVVLVSAPGVVGDRPGFPDRACRLRQLLRRDPAHPRDRFR